MTEGQYWAEVARIKSINPTEPLLSSLERGYSRVGLTYLQLALERLPDDEPEAIEDESDYTSPYLLEKTREIRAAYNSLRKTHNEYHTCKLEKEFAAVATKMNAAWADIQRLIELRKHYRDTGEEAQLGEALPDTPVELARKLNSIRARICHCETAIRDAAQAGEKKRVEKQEGRRRELIALRGLAEQKIKTMEA